MATDTTIGARQEYKLQGARSAARLYHMMQNFSNLDPLSPVPNLEPKPETLEESVDRMVALLDAGGPTELAKLPDSDGNPLSKYEHRRDAIRWHILRILGTAQQYGARKNNF